MKNTFLENWIQVSSDWRLCESLCVYTVYVFPVEIDIYVFKIISKPILRTTCRRFQASSCLNTSLTFNDIPFPDYLNPQPWKVAITLL